MFTIDELAALVYAIWSNAVSLLSGVLGAMFLIASIWIPERHYKRVARLVGLLGLLLSPAYAWRDEYRAKLKIEQQFNANFPSFKGELFTIFTADIVNMHGSVIFILMSISNRGSPASVAGWMLNIKSDAIDIWRAPTFIPEGYQLYYNGKVIARFKKDDAIYEKTVTPILQNTFVRGWLRFEIPNVPAETIRRPNTKLTVVFTDVLGHKFEATKFIDSGPDLSDVPLYYPGTEQRFKGFKK